MCVDGEVMAFDTAEDREEFAQLQGDCVFVKDKKNLYQDYWFCHCSECGYKTNTVLSDEWNYCPKCGTQVRS